MNGLKYIAIVSVLLTVPCCFAATKKAKAAPMPEREVIEEVEETIEMPTPTIDHKELCALEQPTLEPGETITTVEESCPPSQFSICKTIRSRQNFKIHGGCKKECVKCDPYGVCKVVPCCEPCACKPACAKRCCPKPCCNNRHHGRRCCK